MDSYLMSGFSRSIRRSRLLDNADAKHSCSEMGRTGRLVGWAVRLTVNTIRKAATAHPGFAPPTVNLILLTVSSPFIDIAFIKANSLVDGKGTLRKRT